MKVSIVDNYRVNMTAAKRVALQKVTPKILREGDVPIPIKTDKHGFNLETKVGYVGPQSYTPAPDTLPPRIMHYLRMLKVDWKTHVNPNTGKPEYLG